MDDAYPHPWGVNAHGLPILPTWSEIERCLATPDCDIRKLYKSIFAIKTTTSSAEQGIDALVNALQGKVDGEERFLNLPHRAAQRRH